MSSPPDSHLRTGPLDQGFRRHLFRPAQRRVHADPPARAGLLDHQLKEYLPEYDNRLTYVEKRNSSPLRQPLHAIVMEGRNFIYRRDFPIEPPELVKAAIEEGEKAGVKLNALLDDPEAPLEASPRLRDREPEKRWQAHYDLMLAQTVAFQVKAYEYRA